MKYNINAWQYAKKEQIFSYVIYNIGMDDT